LPNQPPVPAFYVEPLGSHHDREAFSCGKERLDSYLRRQATQDVKKHVAVAFVLTNDSRVIAGYYTLSQYSVELDAIPQDIARKLPKYPVVPATLIGRLAMSTAFRGQRLGEFLLMDALNRCLSGSVQVASAAVIVDAKDEEALTFYKKYGFLELPRVSRRLFLPMATIQQLFS
jgi:predicted GNAT family N-acyltransferase